MDHRSYPVSNFTNTFKDIGNREAQMKQAEVGDIENVSLGPPSPIEHALR